MIGLAGEARHRCRADVLEQADAVAEDRPDASRLALVERRPAGVVVGEVDRAVDAPPRADRDRAHVVVAAIRHGSRLLERVELRLGLEQVDAAVDQVDDVLELPLPPRPVRR